MLTTSWPSGSALGKPRKRRKRPPSKVVREQRRVNKTTGQVMRKLTHGIETDPTVPARTDPKRGYVRPEARNLECCSACGGPLRAVRASTDGYLCTLLPDGGRCGVCMALPDKLPPLVRRVGVVRAYRPTLVGEYRQLTAPAEDNPDLRAGCKLARMVRNTRMF